MAELPRSSKDRATPNAPLDDGERNRLVERLNAAYEAGQVSADEYPRLLDTLFGATTLGEVAGVVEVLPGASTHDVPAIVEAGPGRPGELSEARAPSGAMVAKVAAGGVVALVLLLVILFAILL